MISFLNINNKKVNYSDQGKGKVIILLHGYLESIEIWSEFTNELSKKFRVICFDIPGHGQSDSIGDKHTIESITRLMYKSLNELNIDKCFMIGHSMGGYITLMFQKLFPEKLLGFSLFHSHPYADSNEIKKKRLREIQFVNDGKKDLIAKYNIPNAFANDNLDLFKQNVETAKIIALRTSKSGIVANLHAMMNRPDLSNSLSKTKIPFLYIAGKKDNYINFSDIKEKIKLPINSKFVSLENSGHMGFIEEKEISLKIINQFINSI